MDNKDQGQKPVKQELVTGTSVGLGAQGTSGVGGDTEQSSAGHFNIKPEVLVNQAAGMMAQDVRTYLQGCEQILTAGIATSLQ